jgi:hypothetical protein
MAISKGNFFKPGRVPAREGPLTADQVVRQIVSDEAAARDRKTAHLRELREARERAAMVPPAADPLPVVGGA